MFSCNEIMDEHDIPVGCILPTWKPLETALRGRIGPQMNKFEQVSSDHHEMSPAGG